MLDFDFNALRYFELKKNPDSMVFPYRSENSVRLMIHKQSVQTIRIRVELQACGREPTNALAIVIYETIANRQHIVHTNTDTDTRPFINC